MLVVCVGLSASAQAAQFQYTWEKPVGFIPTSSFIAAPTAFLAFCKRHPSDCTPDPAPRYVWLDATRMRDLNTTNMDVNDSLMFNTDLPGHDTWDYPGADGYGDCEDYALEKRRRLMALGWPESSLLLALAQVKGEEIEAWKYHVVLVARTAQGDYMLDDGIRPAVPWRDAAELYTFISMQTPENPQIWANINQSRNASIDSGSIVR